MKYLSCSKLTYAGSDIVPMSSISRSRNLRIKVEIARDKCTAPYEYWKIPDNWSFSRIFVFGRSKITFVEEGDKYLDLGFFDLPSDGGWDYGFYVDLPLTPEIRDLIFKSGTKGSLMIDFLGPGVIIGAPIINSLFSSMIFYVPPISHVIHPKPDPAAREDRKIRLEDEIIEKIYKIDIAQEQIKGETYRFLQDITSYIKRGQTEEAAIALRNFLMNDLTEIDKNKPQGERRRVKKSILDAKLERYEDQAKQNVEKMIETHIQKIIDQNLDILHRYVKDQKVIEIPDLSTIMYVYRNIQSLIRYFDLGDV